MIKVLLVIISFISAFAIPYVHQIALANSLVVGKQDASDLYNWECKVCDETNKPIHTHYIEEKAKDVKCVLSVYNNFVVLAFRYTNTVLNVWQDILYAFQIVDQHTCSNCKVQKAYNNMWEQIKDDVLRDLTQIKKQTKIDILYITGISLGGGLSVISYIDIAHSNVFGTVQVITFGAPRVGNKHWAAHFDQITNNRTLRYIVKGDPIVVLPRCLTLLCTYRQTGIQIVCHENQKQCRQDNDIPEGNLLQDMKTKLRVDSDIRKMKSIIDHIDGYPKIYDFTLKVGNKIK